MSDDIEYLMQRKHHRVLNAFKIIVKDQLFDVEQLTQRILEDSTADPAEAKSIARMALARYSKANRIQGSI